MAVISKSLNLPGDIACFGMPEKKRETNFKSKADERYSQAPAVGVTPWCLQWKLVFHGIVVRGLGRLALK